MTTPKSPEPTGPPVRRRSVVAWVAAALVAAGTAGAIYLAQGPERVAAVAPAPPSDQLIAVELRQRAAAAYGAGHPAECIFLLDKAREKDPAGDASDEVRLLRETSKRAIELPHAAPRLSPSSPPPPPPDDSLSK